MNSSRATTEPSARRSSEAAATAADASARPMTHTARCRIGDTRRSRTRVMTASVPSDPASRPPRSYPVLSFGMPGRRRRIVPSTRTASNPRSWERIVPWRTTFTPPALVATIPPIVAESRAPRSTPTSQPAVRAAACTSASVAPAPTVTSPATRSTSSISFRRSRLITTSPPRGTDPPTSPVLPPWAPRPRRHRRRRRAHAQPRRSTPGGRPPALLRGTGGSNRSHRRRESRDR